MRPGFNFRQCARAYGEFASGANAYPVVQLFNNSTGPQMLVVRAFELLGDNAAGCGSYYDQGHFSAAATSYFKTPIVPGDAAPPGDLYGGGVADFPATQDYFFNTSPNLTSVWYHDFPFAILEPGWSLNFFNGGTQTGLYISVWWQAINAEDLADFPHQR